MTATPTTASPIAPASAPLAALTAWNDLPALSHGFMQRGGGHSAGPFRSLNLSDAVGDDPAAVAANWQLWHAAYPGLRPLRLCQVHGTTVHVVEPTDDSVRQEGDGLVTAARGIAPSIFSADCVPILMVDPACEIVGACHAGWRGTLAGIAREGVHAMVRLGARTASLRVALGPAIGLCCFEVDQRLADEFARKMPTAGACRPGRSGKAFLDLRRLITRQLEGAGLKARQVVQVGPCTRCANDRFFSRRAAGGTTSGLQMSFIGFAE